MLKVLLSLLMAISCFSCTTIFESNSKELGSSPNHWQNIYQYGNATFIKDEIHLSSTGNWFYLTNKKYKDFILEAEVKMPDVEEYSNSGIIFRAKIVNGKKGAFAAGYQAEVDVSDRQWSGGLYHQGSKRQWLHPIHKTRSEPGKNFIKNYLPQWTETMANAYQHLKWNKYRIECRGQEIKIYLNGVLTTHVLDSQNNEGYIGIQHHGSQVLRKTNKTSNIVKFRNLTIIELNEKE